MTGQIARKPSNVKKIPPGKKKEPYATLTKQSFELRQKVEKVR